MSPAASTRWCPTPEQVMILEEMYRGGVRTPNAAQIQQITDHLSLYGKIEGKNVFYWFQNHKARDRQKLRKRLLGKQLHHQHHHVQQQHFDHHHQMMMFQFPTILDHHTSFPQPHDFGLRHRHRHQPLLHHFDQLPCCPTSSTPLVFHQFPPYVTSPCFASQPRAEDTFPRMGNTYPWKGEATIYGKPGVENEKSRRIITNDGNDRMMRGDHHYAYDYDNEDHDGDDDDDDDCGDDEASGRRHLKTLELFPIKDKTSLKEDNKFSGQPNTISFIKV